MVQINWGLAQNGGQNALQMFEFGSQLGQQARARQDDNQRREALAGYAANPSPDGLNALAPYAPDFVLQERGRMQKQEVQQQEQRRADLPLLGRLLEQSTDEESYQRARGIAQQYGVDLSNAPPTFDQNWRDQQLMTVKALSSPKGQEALSAAGKIAMDQGFRPGTPEFSTRVTEIWQASEAKPYVVGGETRLYTPRIGGTGAAVGSPEVAEGATATNPQTGQKIVFQGGQWVPAGGGSGNATGGFHP